MNSVESLYQSLVEAVGRAFSISVVSLFVGDEQTGSFPCRASTASSAGNASHDHELTLSPDSFVIRRLRNLTSALQVDPAELAAWQQALRDAPLPVQKKRMQERDLLLQTKASLLVQLRTKGDLLGVLAVGEGAGRRLTADDREMLESAAGQLALVIENTRLLQRLVEHERLRLELAVAAEVQQKLLPAAGLSFPGIDLCGFCQPASQVGGDYFDYLPLGDNRVAICVADVAGKGISAALMMSVVQASLRGQLFNPQRHTSAATIVATLNRLICASVTAARYVTCFYAQFDAANRSLRFVNAGHNPPLLIRSSLAPADDPAPAAVDKLSCGGLALGLFPDCSFEEGEVVLAPGDVLVSYTDGVTEAMNPQQEEFTEDRLCAAIVETAHRSAREILDHILTRVSMWSAGALQHDDITVVVLKIAG